MTDFNVNQYLKNIAEASKHTQIVKFKINPVEILEFTEGMPFTIHMSSDGSAKAEVEAKTIQEARAIVVQHFVVKEWL